MISNINMSIQSNLDSDLITSNLITFDFNPTPTTTTTMAIVPTSQYQSSQPIPQPSRPPAQQKLTTTPSSGMLIIEMQQNLNDNTTNAFECIKTATVTSSSSTSSATAAESSQRTFDNKVTPNDSADVLKDKSLLYVNKPKEKFIDNDHAYSQPFVQSTVSKSFDDHDFDDDGDVNSGDNNESVNTLLDGGSEKIAPDHHARRPMNAFLIFCKRHRSIVREKYPNLENR